MDCTAFMYLALPRLSGVSTPSFHWRITLSRCAASSATTLRSQRSQSLVSWQSGKAAHREPAKLCASSKNCATSRLWKTSCIGAAGGGGAVCVWERGAGAARGAVRPRRRRCGRRAGARAGGGRHSYQTLPAGQARMAPPSALHSARRRAHRGRRRAAARARRRRPARAPRGYAAGAAPPCLRARRPPSPAGAPPRVVVLDLDHTLVHSGPACVDDAVPGFHVSLGGGDERFYVHVRPHARELVSFLQARDSPAGVRVGFWTAGVPEYAHKVVRGLLWTLLRLPDWRARIVALRSRASALPLADGTYLKDIGVLTRALGTPNVLLIDDDPVHETLPGNRGHIVRVPPYVAGGARDGYLGVVLERFRERAAAA